MTVPSTQTKSSGSRRVPKIVLLLDTNARILSINRSLAGTAFSDLEVDADVEFHDQLHCDCDADCHFYELWQKAWRSLSSSDAVEWEIDDPVSERLLRVNLSKPPTGSGVEIDRRRGHALLILTDITRHRREYESLVKRERALMKIVKAQGTDSEPPANDDDAGGSVGRQVIRAQELERKRIAKELHDGIAQSAGVIKYNIEASIATLSRLDPSLDLGLLEAVVGQTRSLLEEVRRISTNLAPSMLDDFGLCVALQALCDEFRSDTCDFQPTCSACVDESDMPNLVKIAVYRVAQEALNNISKHASATTVKVTVSTSDAGLCLEVSDNGVGLTPGMQASLEANPGSGLQNMRERVESTNGEFSIDAAPEGGTVVRANWNQAALDLLSDEAILDGINSYS